jgi:hypothetical protein
MVGRLGNRNSRAALRRTRFPNQPQQVGHFRQTSGPSLDCDVGTAERYKICQTFRDKAIAAITVHLYVRDYCAFEEGAEILEHAIIGQFLKMRTTEVGGIPHQQQVR